MIVAESCLKILAVLIRLPIKTEVID
jgi:hypothetical protein